MGGSGHFALGNSNTLATVDVAGAYIVRFLLPFTSVFYIYSERLSANCLFTFMMDRVPSFFSK